MKHFPGLLLVMVSIFGAAPLYAETFDVLIRHGRVVDGSGNPAFFADVAVKNGRIAQVGNNDDVLKRRGPRTEVVDLQGRMVLPGLMDSHAHPLSAAMTEFDHPIPEMESIADVLDYIGARSKLQPEGEWIVLQQVFITRLREQRALRTAAT